MTESADRTADVRHAGIVGMENATTAGMPKVGMRLAIADPPYLGRAAVWYGNGMAPSQLSHRFGGTAKINGVRPADNHPDAAQWDNPERHRQLIEDLEREYDGWAVAMAHDNLRHYLGWCPVNVRVGVWVKTQAMPGGARVVNAWEPVVVKIPEGRRASTGQTFFPRDALVSARPNAGFAGAKPAAWTRWVLDMLGYDPESDVVADMFPGSGRVAREIAQGVLA